MKRKIKKIESAKNIGDRISGIGLFRITGPHPEKNERLSIEFYGTRQQAEELDILSYIEAQKIGI